MSYQTEQELKKIWRALKCKSSCNILDSLIVNNGLTKTGRTIQLGGDLIKDTFIDIGTNNFKLTQTPDVGHETEFEMSQDLFGLGFLTGAGFRYKLSDDEWFFVKTSDDTDVGKEHLAAIGYVNLATSEECYMDITANEISLFTSNDGINSTGVEIERSSNIVRIINNGVESLKVSPTFIDFNLSLIPTYADNAAALGGGLLSGMIYKTTTSGSTFLKIVP